MLINKWSGNTTSQVSLADDEFGKLYNFCCCHKRIYVFGDGKIGTGLKQYLINTELPFVGCITSSNLSVFRAQYVKGDVGIIIGVGDKYIQGILPSLSGFIGNRDVFFLTSEKREFLGKHFAFDYVREKFHLNVFVTNVCNLHCRSCSTFAPICKADNYSYEQFALDIVKFESLATPINVLKFTGGEPFLHPSIFGFFSKAREVYPEIRIECYTNGLLLSKLSDSQKKILNAMKIELTITEYPLTNLDLSAIYNVLDKHAVSYNVIEKGKQKYFSKRPLNFDNAVPKHLFINCPRYKYYSLFLNNGKLYKCTYAIAAKYFNEYFKTNLSLDDSDFLILNDVENQTQLFTFLVNRIPFCGYCEPISELVPWGLSERKLEEWS
ncbi:MAG: radical SAM protein [Gracilibacteraceae bacterium]|jgi:organic radical activating enzyme|nr:radical SAM protein [Gracilibacteraceae bacterium]